MIALVLGGMILAFKHFMYFVFPRKCCYFINNKLLCILRLFYFFATGISQLLATKHAFYFENGFFFWVVLLVLFNDELQGSSVFSCFKHVKIAE